MKSKFTEIISDLKLSYNDPLISATLYAAEGAFYYRRQKPYADFFEDEVDEEGSDPQYSTETFSARIFGFFRF